MGKLTTHVLDTAQGRPAADVAVALYRNLGERYALLKTTQTNADGRCEAPLLEGAAFSAGRYRLVFGAGAYFARQGLRAARAALRRRRGDRLRRRRRQRPLPRAAAGHALELLDLPRQLSAAGARCGRRRYRSKPSEQRLLLGVVRWPRLGRRRRGMGGPTGRSSVASSLFTALTRVDTGYQAIASAG